MHYLKKNHIMHHYYLTLASLLIVACGMLMMKSFYTGGFTAAPAAGISRWGIAVLTISIMIVSLERVRHKK